MGLEAKVIEEQECINAKVIQFPTGEELIETSEGYITFSSLFLKYHQRVIWYIYKKVRNITTAEDLAADTFEKAWKNLAKFKGGLSFEPWLYTIANNTTRDYLTKQSVHCKKEPQIEPPTEIPNPEVLVSEKDMQIKIEAFIKNNLSPNQARRLCNYIFSDKTYAEIAEEEGITRDAAKSTSENNRKRLRIKRKQLGI